MNTHFGKSWKEHPLPANRPRKEICGPIMVEVIFEIWEMHNRNSQPAIEEGRNSQRLQKELLRKYCYGKGKYRSLFQKNLSRSPTTRNPQLQKEGKGDCGRLIGEI